MKNRTNVILILIVALVVWTVWGLLNLQRYAYTIGLSSEQQGMIYHHHDQIMVVVGLVDEDVDPSLSAFCVSGKYRIVVSVKDRSQFDLLCTKLLRDVTK